MSNAGEGRYLVDLVEPGGQIRLPRRRFPTKREALDAQRGIVAAARALGWCVYGSEASGYSLKPDESASVEVLDLG